jgi:hypothetical protein
MNRFSRMGSVALMTALLAACASAPHDSGGQSEIDYRAALGAKVPGGSSGSGGTSGSDWPDGLVYDADGPYPVDLASVPVGEFDPNNQLDRKGGAGRPEMPISEEVAALLREEAMLLPPQAEVFQPMQAGPGQLGPTAGTSFDSLDYGECCGGGGNVPPDPELAVGPGHAIAVVNVAFEIYDKSGTSLSGPLSFSSFFNGTPGCSNTGVFDPNALYDEEHDRYIVGIDGNGDNYCIAASVTGDPMGDWNTYAFPTTVSGSEFFDYPHAGVGLDAIYMGANIFTGGFSEARVWAIDKLALYSGGTVSVVGRSTGGESTPQPMNLHGWDQGTWPVSGPHYIITDGDYNGAIYGVWSWDDPFGVDVFIKVGNVDLVTGSGVITGFPIDVPQQDGSLLQSNDWRVQDAEYRNGMIWTATAVSCNPGSGTVGCVRWAQIDPAGPTVVDAGVLGSNDEHRTFGDVAVNHCDDMAIGYTKTSSSIYPGVYVSGRESGDADHTLQTEVLMKAGEKTYTPFDGAPHRWGDYTEMTIDPDGQTFWYLGQYSKSRSGTNWGTYIGSFTFAACSPDPQPPGKASSPNPGNDDTGVEIDATMSWSAGSGATGHVVTFEGVTYPEQGGTTFDPGPLAYSTTYNWQVDEVNTQDTTEGDAWSFTTRAVPVLPDPANTPGPTDGATDVSVAANLSWTAGNNAVTHDVYFGTDSTPDAGEFRGNQAGTGFNPDAMVGNTTYYWRIDEVNGDGETTGPIWSFTTEEVVLPKFHVHEINVEAVHVKGPRYRGVATITLWDEVDQSQLLDGVEISGKFSGHWSGDRGGTTVDGVLVVETPPVKNGSDWDFCVDIASLAGWEHDLGASGTKLCTPVPQDTGSISGVVTKDGGLAISGANVSADSGQSTTTSGDGSYTLNNVPVGQRTVTASASGYDPENSDVPVSKDSTSPLDFALTPSTDGGGFVQVRSITVSTVNQGQGNKKGRAVVVVEDGGGSVVPGAVVSGHFEGTFPDVVGPASTNSGGSVTFDTAGQKKGGVSVTFCVDLVTHLTLAAFVGPQCVTL